MGTQRPDETAKSGLSRRGLLRAAGATGIVAATTAAVAFGSAPNALAAQAGWRWCSQCQHLWFGYNPTLPFAWCPTGDTKEHIATHSGDYVVKFASEGGGGQDGWRYCEACLSLFFTTGGARFVGKCAAGPTGRAHQGGLTVYRVEVHWSNDGPGGQEGWSHCPLCQVLWFSGGGSNGYCEYNKERGHHASSGRYKLRFGPPM